MKDYKQRRDANRKLEKQIDKRIKNLMALCEQADKEIEEFNRKNNLLTFKKKHTPKTQSRPASLKSL